MYVGLSAVTDTFTSSIWDRWAPAPRWASEAVGDFNGDGQADVLGRFDLSRWVVDVSDGTTFNRSFLTRWP